MGHCQLQSAGNTTLGPCAHFKLFHLEDGEADIVHPAVHQFCHVQSQGGAAEAGPQLGAVVVKYYYLVPQTDIAPHTCSPDSGDPINWYPLNKVSPEIAVPWNGSLLCPLNTLTGWEFSRASSCREGMRTSLANCSHSWNSGHTLDMRITAG